MSTPIADAAQYDTGLRVDENDTEPDYVVSTKIARALEAHCEAMYFARNGPARLQAFKRYLSWKREQLGAPK